MVVLGLLATVTVVSLREVGRQVRLDDVVDQLMSWDRNTREQARWMDRPLGMICDLRDQTLAREMGGDWEGKADQSNYVVPRGFRIGRVLLDDAEPVDQAEARWSYSPTGQSNTYALQVHSIDAMNPGSIPGVWLVFAGGTGQCTRIEGDDSYGAVYAWFETMDNPKGLPRE